MPILFGVTSAGKMVPIRVNDDGLIDVQSSGWIGAAWQKNPLAFGYSAAVFALFSNTALAAGTNTLAGTTVPAGEIQVITNITVNYTGTVAGVTLQVQAYDGANPVPVFYIAPPVSAVWYPTQGWFVIPPGGDVRAVCSGATLNDDMLLRYSGFRVDIDQ